MNSIDLQIQTTVSDGKHSPRECIRMARENGVAVAALTDHDTVDGVPEALQAGGEFGVRVIPGIEFSVEEHGAHILGYGIDYQDGALKTALEGAKRSRLEGAKKMMENLRRNEGFMIEWEDVVRESGGASVIASPHIVYAILKRPENREKLDGVTKNDFYKKYLFENGPNYVRRTHISAKDAIGLIHGVGGIAIWSHPAIHFGEAGVRNYDGLELFLRELMGWGVDGLEVFSPSHTEDDVEFLHSLAKEKHLLVTAGSDFHEMGEHHRSPEGLHSAENIGDYETYGFPIDDIVPKLDEAIIKQRGG